MSHPLNLPEWPLHPCWVFLDTNLDWRKVAVFALLAIAIGNLISAYTLSFSELAVVRFFTASLGHGTAYALGAAILGATSNPIEALV